MFFQAYIHVKWVHWSTGFTMQGLVVHYVGRLSTFVVTHRNARIDLNPLPVLVPLRYIHVSSEQF